MHTAQSWRFAISICFVLRLFQFTSAQSTTSIPLWPIQTFKSAPSVNPLALEVNKTGPIAGGYIFLNPSGSSHPNSTAPIIADGNGELIWYGPRGQAFNFGPYQYHGETVLAYWNGTVFPEPVGRGFGTITLLNSSYDIVATVTLAGDFRTLNASQEFSSNIDLHELNITPVNTILVTANNVTQRDLSAVGGPEYGWVVDAIVYEIDIATNKVLFEWHALDHLDRLPYSASQLKIGDEGFNGTTQSSAWNYFHINAVSQLNDHKGYIISSRYLCSEIAVQKSNGEVLWVLSGIDGGDFQLASNASFCYQHDVRQQRELFSNGDLITISLFDNANSPLTLPDPTIPSSGLTLRLNTISKTAIGLARYQNPSVDIYSTAQGNVQYLPNDHTLVGYGFTPFFQEFDAAGASVMTAQFGPIAAGMGIPAGGVISYRVFLGAWVGCPRTKPDVTALKEDGGIRLWMSWNGATEYTSWRILAGNSSANLQVMGEVGRSGFETSYLIPSKTNLVQVQALGMGACAFTEAQMKSQIMPVA
jgi:hypothetical protein